MSTTWRTPSIRCKYYQQNACTRGDECPFSHTHSPIHASVKSPQIMPVCQYFQRGVCQYGHQCRQLHLAPAVPTEQYPTTKACVFFAKSACSKGSACPFSHEIKVVAGLVQSGDQNDLAKPLNKTRSASAFSSCKFFSQGRCMKGDACPFPHPVESAPVPYKTTSGHGTQTPSIEKVLHRALPMPISTVVGETQIFPVAVPDSSSSTTDRTYMHCQVAFGLGARVDSIVTPFESRRCVLSNLPSDVSQGELITLMEPHGHLEKVLLHKSATGCRPTAVVDFMDASHAATAVRELNRVDQRFREVTIGLDLRSAQSGTATLRSCKIKMSWYAPSTVAWAHYPTISMAKHNAVKLNDCMLDGRKISATFQTPRPRQRDSFSVCIKGLPVGVSGDHLTRFCSATSVTIGQASYSKLASIDDIRHVLEGFGQLEAFDVLPTQRKDTKIKAFAQFSSSEAAQEAVKRLHGVPQDFIKRSPIWVQNVHSIKYTIPTRQFTAIKQEVEDLRARTAEECKLRYYDMDEDGGPIDPVCVRVHGTDPKLLGRTKSELERLLAGELLSERSRVWDEFFETREGRDFLDNIYEACQCFVQCDGRKRSLRLFGSEAHRNHGRKIILDKVAQLVASRHNLRVEKHMLRGLLSGGLTALEQSLGPGMVSLDVVSRILTIRGDDEDVKRAYRVIASNATPNYATAAHPASDCPVCFCDATDPTTLPCGHSYCTTCLQHLLKSVSETKLFPVGCVYEGDGEGQCRQQVPLAFIRDLLSPNEEDQLLNCALLSYIHERPEEFRYCPSPDCQVIYRPGPVGAALRCPACLIRICPACHVEYHEGLTCSEHRDNTSGGEEAFRNWRAEHGVKPCPKCGADLEKNGGCNHMECARCKTHMCWVCMKTFTQDDNVYRHMRQEHGGIGV